MYVPALPVYPTQKVDCGLKKDRLWSAAWLCVCSDENPSGSGDRVWQPTQDRRQSTPENLQNVARSETPRCQFIRNVCMQLVLILFQQKQYFRLYELPSGHASFVLRTHNSFGDRSFSAAGPRVWNSLPPHLRQDMNFERFQHKLKTFLFGN